MLKVTSKVKNKIAGCLTDSRGMLAAMHISNVEKEERKTAGLHSKYDQMIIIY